MDNGAKQFLWKAIVRTPDVEFFVLAEPFPHIFGTKHREGTEKESANYQAQNPLDQVFNIFRCARTSSKALMGTILTTQVCEIKRNFLILYLCYTVQPLPL